MSPFDHAQGPKGQKVSLEDLLKVKRAERPPAEFWPKFEEQLRAKQLAAIVHRRSWWDSLPRLSLRTLWVQLPAGAAAAIALTLVVVRDTEPNQPVAEPATVTAIAPKPVSAAPTQAIAPEISPAATIASAVEAASVQEAVVATIPAVEATPQVNLASAGEGIAEAFPVSASTQLIAKSVPSFPTVAPTFATFASMAVEQQPAKLDTTRTRDPVFRSAFAKTVVDRISTPELSVESMPAFELRKEHKPAVEADSSLRWRLGRGGITTAFVGRDGA